MDKRFLDCYWQTSQLGRATALLSLLQSTSAGSTPVGSALLVLFLVDHDLCSSRLLDDSAVQASKAVGGQVGAHPFQPSNCMRFGKLCTFAYCLFGLANQLIHVVPIVKPDSRVISDAAAGIFGGFHSLWQGPIHFLINAVQYANAWSQKMHQIPNNLESQMRCMGLCGRFIDTLFSSS